MKKQAATTLTTLSLFIALSVGASNAFGFPGGCAGCKPSVSYAAAASARTANPGPVRIAQDTEPTEAESENSVGFIARFWTHLTVFFKSLF